MRVLVIGAGALGGYFGACLARAGRDVTFLVRPKRAAQLRAGLQVVSPHGDFTVPARTVLAEGLAEGLTRPFDLILLATKAYSLAEAMDQFAPAVGPDTAILPILNGMAHLDALSARFGAGRVLGGMSLISATLDAEGRVLNLLPNHELVFGDIAGGSSPHVAAITALFDGAGFAPRASAMILQDMWEKWVGNATTAGITSMMRAPLGDIIAAPGGGASILRLFNEGAAVAAAAGFSLRQPIVDFATKLFTQAGSPVKASMLRDIERGAPTEAEHVLGDMAERARALGVATPILDLARIHVAAYEAGRARAAAPT